MLEKIVIAAVALALTGFCVIVTAGIAEAINADTTNAVATLALYFALWGHLQK